MKKLVLLGGLLSLATLSACSTISDPVAYNDQIVDIIGAVDDAYIEYSTYATETSLEFTDRIDERRLSTIDTINEYTTQLDTIQAYQDDNSLIDIARADVANTLSLLENEEKQLIDLRYEVDAYPSDEWTQEIEDEYMAQQKAITQSISEKREESAEAFVSVQSAFATAHGYELESD